MLSHSFAVGSNWQTLSGARGAILHRARDRSNYAFQPNDEPEYERGIDSCLHLPAFP